MTQKPRGFGFVTFKEQEAADRAFQEEHVLDGRTVRRRGQQRTGPQHTCAAQQQCISSLDRGAPRGVRPTWLDSTQQSCWLKLQASAVAAAAAQLVRLPSHNRRCPVRSSRHSLHVPSEGGGCVCTWRNRSGRHYAQQQD